MPDLKIKSICEAIETNNSEAFNVLLKAGASFGPAEEKLIGEQLQFKDYFNSPDCFLTIVEAENLSALKFILRHIKGIPHTDQKPFLDIHRFRQRG